MDGRKLVGLLNDLLDLETSGLLGRLEEVHPFVAPFAAEDLPHLRGIVAAERQHRRRLTEAITELGGAPHPILHDTSSAGAHYLNARHLLGQLVEDMRRLVAAFERAVGALTSSPAAGETVAAILAEHRAHLSQLEAMAGRAA